MHKIFLLASAFSLAILSCKKGDDFIDNTAQFPLGWKSSDSFQIIAYNMKDTLGNIMNVGTTQFGTLIDPNFGKVQAGFFANFQTTLNSTSFSFSSIDSAVLVLPYLSGIPKYGKCDQPFDIYVYELTEALETTSTSKRMNYNYDANPVGTKLGYTANTSDSVLDGSSLSAPSIRINLSSSFASKLTTRSYTDDADFQSVFRGLYIKPGNNSTNGFLMINLGTSLRIKIYGKNSSGTPVLSEFQTGGTKSTTVNQFTHDNSSIAYSASQTPNTVSGDAKLYNHGVFGYYSQLVLPNITDFGKNKEIFKAQLTLYSLDTGFQGSSELGIMYIDSVRNREAATYDDLYKLNHRESVKDTVIAGIPTRRFVYNIGMHINGMISGQLPGRKFNLYSAPLANTSSGSSKFSNLLPSRIILAGICNL